MCNTDPSNCSYDYKRKIIEPDILGNANIFMTHPKSRCGIEVLLSGPIKISNLAKNVDLMEKFLFSKSNNRDIHLSFFLN